MVKKVAYGLLIISLVEYNKHTTGCINHFATHLEVWIVSINSYLYPIHFTFNKIIASYYIHFNQFLNGSCSYGQNCKYVHWSPSRKRCWYFKKGRCWFGDKCRWAFGILGRLGLRYIRYGVGICHWLHMKWTHFIWRNAHIRDPDVSENLRSDTASAVLYPDTGKCSEQWWVH